MLISIQSATIEESMKHSAKQPEEAKHDIFFCNKNY